MTGLALVTIGLVREAHATEAVAAAGGVTLLMVEWPGCRYCARWNAEIGPAYGNSLAGRFAPLVRVQRDAIILRNLNPVVFTPTFIVMSGPHEVSRISGYPGQDYFWSELRDALVPAGFKQADGLAATPVPGRD